MKNWELLTEYNDPVNMGTYNYNYNPTLGNLDNITHALYDVLPYSNEKYAIIINGCGWGNVKGVFVDATKAIENLDRFTLSKSENPDSARTYRKNKRDEFISIGGIAIEERVEEQE
jgi:hypothetical protein